MFLVVSFSATSGTITYMRMFEDSRASELRAPHICTLTAYGWDPRSQRHSSVSTYSNRLLPFATFCYPREILGGNKMAQMVVFLWPGHVVAK